MKPTLTVEQRARALQILENVRESIAKEAGGDPLLEFALRRFVYLTKALILAACLITYGLGGGPALAKEVTDVFVTNPATQPVPVQVALPEPFQITVNPDLH